MITCTRLPLIAVFFGLFALSAGCTGEALEGLAPSQSAATTVVLDFFHKPLPEIPLPNDLATRFDSSAATGRRLNASMLAATGFERRTRELVDRLDGWGTYQPISVPFSSMIDIASIVDHHHGDNFNFSDDVIYLVDVTPGSPTYLRPVELDVGNGNFPLALEKIDHYWAGDPRSQTNTMLFEETDEDINANGKLDPGEDTDLDGLLDKPNWFPMPHGRFDPAVHKDPAKMDLAQRSDAMMTFYERETNTLIVRALVPLRPKTTYAMVVTRRLLDADKKPVGSPYAWIHHLGQKDALAPLPDALATNAAMFGNLKLSDVAFAWTFTTASVQDGLVAMRDGLYGFGPQKHLAEEFPAQLSDLNRLQDGDKPGKKFENLYTVSGESFSAVISLVTQGGLIGSGGPNAQKRSANAQKYVSHHVFGTYKTPRMFRRTDEHGNYLGYNQMAWPEQLGETKAAADPEEVTFWMSFPRKEATADGKPRGVVILGHGYGSNKTEMLEFHSYFARQGLIAVAIDNVSHGLDLNAKDSASLDQVLGILGLRGLGRALTRNRSWDQDLDGVGDTGADFWSAYTFHTRDVVRQTAVDYMQLIRVIRSWDGKRKWQWDVNGDAPGGDLAGDFDGDGQIDIDRADIPITMTGGSLGGIMAAVVGGSEPQLTAILPVAGGGGLIDVGIRSIQGGVKEAVTLRLMGPLYVGFADSGASELAIKTIVPSLNSTAEIEVARLTKDQVAKLAVGDTLLARNLDNGEYDCSYVRADTTCVANCKADDDCKKACLTFRVALASDVVTSAKQRHVLSFYKGDVFQPGVRDPQKHRACKLKDGAADPVVVVDRFGSDVQFHHRSAPLYFAKGSRLSPIAEGLGLHRARPSMRRFMGFAQMVLDPSDPAVWARNYHSGELVYRNGEVVKTHALVLNTVGDMNVPVNTGAAIGRAAGHLDWRKPVPEWGGRTVNQVLVDTFVIEAVDKIPRYVDSKGTGVLFDPENLSKTTTEKLPSDAGDVKYAKAAARGNDGFEVPRLDPPLHTHAMRKDADGNWSGTFFPYIEPGGKHGFHAPGKHTDDLIKACEASQQPKIDASKSCNDQPWFDHGAMLVDLMGDYLASGGKQFRLEPCMSTGECSWVQPPPKKR